MVDFPGKLGCLATNMQFYHTTSSVWCHYLLNIVINEINHFKVTSTKVKSSLLNPSTLCLQQKFRQVNNWIQNSDQRLEIYFSNQVIELFLFFTFFYLEGGTFVSFINELYNCIDWKSASIIYDLYVYKLHETQPLKTAWTRQPY